MKLSEIISLIFATGFGAGYAPKAPGTAGSLLAILLFLGISHLDLYIYLFTLVVVFALSVYASEFAGRYFNDVDAPKIVIDEIIGMFITYIPLYFFPINAINLAIGFILFRLFDITKPFPANWANRIKRPVFVILDDIFAAIYAAIVLTLALILRYR